MGLKDMEYNVEVFLYINQEPLEEEYSSHADWHEFFEGLNDGVLKDITPKGVKQKEIMIVYYDDQDEETTDLGEVNHISYIIPTLKDFSVVQKLISDFLESVEALLYSGFPVEEKISGVLVSPSMKQGE